MVDRGTIALLVPAYNAAAHLPRLLGSAAAQTEPFDEIWVYDDCSTDDTGSVAARLGARVIRGEVNRGCSHGKNILAGLTRCDWLHFHDADDDLKPGFVALARRWISDGGFDVILFAYEEIDDATDERISVRRFDPDDVARDARSYAIREQINAINGLYRRTAFINAGGYDEDPLVLYNEDVAMHIRLAFAGLSFAAETEVAIVNRRRSSSMSSANAMKCIEAHYHVLRKASEELGAALYKSEIATKLWAAAAGAAAHMDWATADAAALLAMRLAGPVAAPSTAGYKALCQISPRLALRTRELAMRLFRPHTRIHHPPWNVGSVKLQKKA